MAILGWREPSTSAVLGLRASFRAPQALWPRGRGKGEERQRGEWLEGATLDGTECPSQAVTSSESLMCSLG